jgi:hypothetical protein
MRSQSADTLTAVAPWLARLLGLRLPRWLGWLLRLTVSVGVLGFVAWELQALQYSARTLLGGLLPPGGYYGLVAVLLAPCNLWLEAWKWQLLMPQVPMLRAVRAVLAGTTLALLTPGRLGEYLGRSLGLPAGQRLRGGLATFYARIAQMLVTGVAGVWAAVWLFAYSDFGAAYWQSLRPHWGLLLLGAVVLLGVLVVGVGVAWWAWQWLRSSRGRALRRLLGSTPVPKAAIAGVVALAVVRYAVFTLQLLLLLAAFDVRADWGLLAALTAVIFLLKSLVPAIALSELGVRESLALFFFGLVGLPAAAAFNATLLLYLLNRLVPALAGLPLLWRREAKR